MLFAQPRQDQHSAAAVLQVGLFFQDELTAAAGGTAGGHDSPAPHPMPVLLLSEDRAQLSLARSHGLPAARLSDLSLLPAALNGQQPLSSSLLRRTLAPAATTGSFAGCKHVQVQRLLHIL